jgi:hypothetical protein
MHKIPRGTSKNAQNYMRKFQKYYLRVPHGIVYIFEVPRGILCIFGISSYNFVHFWKFLVGFCARIFRKCTKSHEELPKRHKIPHRTSINAQNHTRIFRKCTKSHEELPNIVLCGIVCLFGSSSWDFVHFRKNLVGFYAYLEVLHGILCIFGRSSWEDFMIHFK